MDQKFYHNLLDSMADGVYFVDRERRVTYWNKAAERISGYLASEVIGKSCADNVLRHVDTQGTQLCLKGCPLAATMQDAQVREVDVFMHHKSGHRIPVSVRASPMYDEEGRIIGAVEIFSDNSKNIDLLQELEELRQEVLRDKLTGIGNRRYAELTLQNYEKAHQESQVPYGVLFVDIDFFKKVNDSWGHNVGDLVLRMVAQTLAKGLRPLDATCRWGGEEFLVIAPNINAVALTTMAERLRMLIANSWLDYDGATIQVTASFGGAIAITGEPSASVVGRADKQVYLSKERGRNCVHIDAG